MPLRDHQGVVIEEFNGLWARGEPDSVPPDHFVDCNNIQFVQSGFKTRDGLDTYLGYPRVVRIYTFVKRTGESLLILDDTGKIYDSGSPSPLVPILNIPGMIDFGALSYNSRAYITPCTTKQDNFGNNFLVGMQNEFVYVYKGDGTYSRKAGGLPPVGTLNVGQTPGGNIEPGVHNFAVLYETDTGFQTKLAGFASVNFVAGATANITTIPVSPDIFVTARWIVATKAIDPAIYANAPNPQGYQFFFVHRIPDNTTTSYNASFFDVELLVDASHLLDLSTFIAAGAGLNTYHGRMLIWASYSDEALMRVSYPGEPEAIDNVTGLIIPPLDGYPLTNAQEFRDVLYVFKKVRTLAFADNGDVPTTWPLTVIDQGIGASNHGVSTVLDSGGVNIDYLLVADYSGIMLFNGAYTRPELTWKIKDFWYSLDRAFFLNIQIMNDSLLQILYITLPNKQMLIGDYSNALNPKDIRWAKWSFNIETTTIALIEINKLIVGSRQLLTPA